MNIRLSALLLPLLALVACSGDGQDGPVVVSAIGRTGQIVEPLTAHESFAGRVVLGATARGLVSLDANGEVVPALAQRWIVVDAGRSYIFRLRRARWTNGDRVDAREVAQLLETRIRVAARADPFGNMAAVKTVRPMTTDVVEIQLDAARPNFLTMLAQPQLAIARKTGGTGPYAKQRTGELLTLTPLATPEVDADAADIARQARLLRGERVTKAIARFRTGEADLVLGGSLADYPYLGMAGVDRAAIRLDPVMGLFGLAVVSHTALTDDPAVRAALAMAIDRDRLPPLFDFQGWAVSDQALPQQLNLARAPSRPAWATLNRDDRRTRAAGVIARWRAQQGGKSARVTIRIGDGPGERLLFLRIAHDLRAIGVTARAVEKGGDLALLDAVAPYDSAFWFLSQLSCKRGVHCDPAMETALKEAGAMEDMQARAEKLSEAEALAVAHNGYIALGAPVRWSLVSRRLSGFSASPRAWHPLDRLVK